MNNSVANFLEQFGEEGENVLYEIAPNFIKKLHMCRQQEIIKQHKLAEEELSYAFPKGDQASGVPSIKEGSRSMSHVSAVAVELESMRTSFRQSQT